MKPIQSLLSDLPAGLMNSGYSSPWNVGCSPGSRAVVLTFLSSAGTFNSGVKYKNVHDGHPLNSQSRTIAEKLLHICLLHSF